MSGKQHPLIWEKTKDGRDQLRSTLYDDPFFSSEGGRAECAHVFISGNHLPPRWKAMGEGEFTIAELGFGTGLNFLETWHQWIELRGEGQMLNFVSFEGFPLPLDALSRALKEWPELASLADALKAKWDNFGTKALNLDNDTSQIWQMDGQTTLQVIQAPIEEGLALWQGSADAWYLDGFSPSKNPEMWSQTVMRLISQRTNPKGTVSSYTSAGWIRRNLENAGFEVQRVQGFGKKRHMITGQKI